MKKILALVACLSLVASLAIGGSIAYLTDRDSKANIFTIGNVDITLNENFASSKLVPGTTITKEATISNEGDTDAYVWMTVAVPESFDTTVDSDEKFALFLDLDSNKEQDAKWTQLAKKTSVKIDESGNKYNIYTLLYNDILPAGSTTASPALNSVTLSEYVDITPEGDMYFVMDGQTTSLNWNVNTHNLPVVYVSAYAIQSEGFVATEGKSAAQVAYDAYNTQWGDNGAGEIYTNFVTVRTAEELTDAIETAQNGELVVIEIPEGTTIAATQIKIGESQNVSIVGKGTFKGQFKVTGKLALSGITVDDPDAAVAGEVSQYSKSAIALMNNGDVICENVTFNQDLTEGSAITAWWSTGDGANITVKNCTFNSNGQRPIRSDACVNVENCTFNDPYRYAVQMTSKSSTMDSNAEAYVIFKNNTINAGSVSTKDAVYGIQLEGSDYGCSDLTINGSGNTINLGNTGKTGTMYYCECGKVEHATVVWNTEVTPTHENFTDEDINDNQGSTDVGDTDEEFESYTNLDVTKDTGINPDTNQVWFEDVKLNVNSGAAVIIDEDSTIFMKNCNFTVGENEYVLDAKGGTTVVYYNNVTINGQLLTGSTSPYFNTNGSLIDMPF